MLTDALLRILLFLRLVADNAGELRPLGLLFKRGMFNNVPYALNFIDKVFLKPVLYLTMFPLRLNVSFLLTRFNIEAGSTIFPFLPQLSMAGGAGSVLSSS